MSSLLPNTFRVRFHKLSGAGHDEWEKAFSEIETDFNDLMTKGYALFINEQQVKSLTEVEELWRELGQPAEVKAYAVPALRGGLDIDSVCAVCGMEVEGGPQHHTASYRNKPYYFCSNDCREEFVAAPEDYVEFVGDEDDDD